MLPLTMHQPKNTGKQTRQRIGIWHKKTGLGPVLISVLATMIWLADIWLNADGHNRC